MDKLKVNRIIIEMDALTLEERAFLVRKLMKQVQVDACDLELRTRRLVIGFDNAHDSIIELTKEIEQYKAKEAFDTLKNAEQKLKESGGLGVVENETERHEWDRDNEGFNILKEFGCAAARNIDKAAMSSIENGDTKTSTRTTGTITAKILFNT